jgi:hypothetical protein
MGKLMRTAGHLLGAGVLVLAGSGVLLVLAGSGVANARPASTNACDTLISTLKSLDAIHPGTADNLKKDAPLVASKLTQAASTGSPALKSAVSTYVADWEAGAAAGHLDTSKISADDDAIAAACAAELALPSGAPATGGGSAAGVRDPALFGVGGAAVLVGLGVLGLARRNRPRGSLGQG